MLYYDEAVCCSMSYPCVAVCCSHVLQHVAATCCSMVQSCYWRYSMLRPCPTHEYFSKLVIFRRPENMLLMLWCVCNHALSPYVAVMSGSHVFAFMLLTVQYVADICCSTLQSCAAVPSCSYVADAAVCFTHVFKPCCSTM